MKSKQKRVKKVFSSSSQVLHMWASQTQTEGRQGGGISGGFGSSIRRSGSRCFFEGTTVYSYGYHYKLGELVTFKGVQIALINTTGYSKTTKNHIYEAKQAVAHLPIIEVDDHFNVYQGILTMQGKLIDSLFKILNEQSFWSQSKVTNERFNKFNQLVTTLGMNELVLNPDSQLIDIINEHIQYRLARQKELDANSQERAEKRKALNIVKAQKEVSAWLSGGSLTRNIREITPQLIRVNGDVVETSRGATVPYEDAVSLAQKLVNKVDISKQKVGGFTVDSVQGNIVKIGCHTFDLTSAIGLLRSEGDL